MENEKFLRQSKRENDKRIDKCEKILFEVNALIEQNSSARSIGFFDAIAGGFFVSLYKKNKIDKLKSKLQDIKWLLKEYKNIADEKSLLVSNRKVNIEISNILMDTDIIFDNIISDLMVNNKLEKFNNQLLELRNNVNNELMRLKSIDLHYRNILDGFPSVD
ncbi:MAG: hypothetical protein ACRCTZ_18900 [Sarcina sp.]